MVADEPDVRALARMTREAEEFWVLEAQMAFADLAFAVFVARGRSGRIGRWCSSNDVLTRVEVTHGAAAGEQGPWLRISTERERHRHESEAVLARSALRTVLQDVHLAARPQRSSAGVAIWLDAVERQARRAAAHSVIEKRTMLVDGAPMPFVTAAYGAHWSAAGRRDDLLLLVTAYDVDREPVELVSVTDPLAALAPRQPLTIACADRIRKPVRQRDLALVPHRKRLLGRIGGCLAGPQRRVRAPRSWSARARPPAGHRRALDMFAWQASYA